MLITFTRSTQTLFSCKLCDMGTDVYERLVLRDLY